MKHVLWRTWMRGGSMAARVGSELMWAAASLVAFAVTALRDGLTQSGSRPRRGTPAVGGVGDGAGF